jgi:hypothetical protein
MAKTPKPPPVAQPPSGFSGLENWAALNKSLKQPAWMAGAQNATIPRFGQVYQPPAAPSPTGPKTTLRPSQPQPHQKLLSQAEEAKITQQSWAEMAKIPQLYNQFTQADINRYTAPNQDASTKYANYLSFIQKFAPSYSWQSHRQLSPLDLMSNVQHPGEYSPHPQLTPQQELAQEYKGSKAEPDWAKTKYVPEDHYSRLAKGFAELPFSWGFSMKDVIPGIGDAISGIFGGGGDTKKVATPDQSENIIKTYALEMMKKGMTEDQAMNALADVMHPGMTQKDMPDPTNKKASAKFVKQITDASYEHKLHQMTSPAAATDAYIKSVLDPQENAHLQELTQIRDEFSAWYSRKQAGLTGKKLGTNPMTGRSISRKWLGLQQGDTITPEAFSNAIDREANDKTKAEFTRVMGIISDNGFLGPLTKYIHQQILQHGGPKGGPGPKITDSIKAMYNDGSITLPGILTWYTGWQKAVSQESGGGPAGGDVTSNPLF